MQLVLSARHEVLAGTLSLVSDVQYMEQDATVSDVTHGKTDPVEFGPNV